MSLSESLKDKGRELGFDLVGITAAEAIDSEHSRILKHWLGSGYAGQMHYMERNLEKRINPVKLMDGVRSVIVTAVSYKADEPAAGGDLSCVGRVANYGRYKDYHRFVKKMLRDLAGYLIEQAGSSCRFKLCVDSVPLAERSFAVKAGLGFIGKNHMLINPALGAELFLGEIITNVELESDERISINCGDCDECVQACPTGALRADGQFDARRCINYLTIEYDGQIPEDLRTSIGNRVFGCDRCVEVCPFHRRARGRSNMGLKYYPDRVWLDLNEVLEMTPEQFEACFADSPIKRAGLENLKRNARVCLENRRRSSSAISSAQS